jgi:cyclophilin family peptidyl-prolyl cis-trans isomerase
MRHTLLVLVGVLAGCSSQSAGGSPTAPAEYKVKFDTSKGSFVIEVHREWAPNGADRFYELVKSGYFDEARFFRVVPDFVVQWGINKDPKVSAEWREKSIPDDKVRESNKLGYVTFAMRGPNTRTTQIFINLKDNSSLDGQGFAPFARVVEGMDVVQALYSGYGQRAQQGLIQTQGNAYLQREFPQMDYIKTARVAGD